MKETIVLFGELGDNCEKNDTPHSKLIKVQICTEWYYENSGRNQISTSLGS